MSFTVWIIFSLFIGSVCPIWKKFSDIMEKLELTVPVRTRFWRAVFRQFCVRHLDNTGSIVCGAFLALTKNCSVKTAGHLTASYFRGILVLRNAGGLAPAKWQRAKSPEKRRCEAGSYRHRQLKQYAAAKAKNQWQYSALLAPPDSFMRLANVSVRA